MNPIFLLPFLLLLFACSEPVSRLQEVQERGFIRVVSRISPASTAALLGRNQAFEENLARGFADYLNVEARFSIAHLADIPSSLIENRADFAAAGLIKQKIGGLRFASSYQDVSPVLVTRRDEHGRTSFDKRNEHREIIVSSGFKNSLIEMILSDGLASSTLRLDESRDSEELLLAVATGQIPATLTTSNELIRLQHSQPQLIDVLENNEIKLQLAWAFKNSLDESLFNKAEDYFKELINSHQLEKLIDQYYGHSQEAAYWDNLAFIERIDTRLPEFKSLFQKAAEKYGLDWRLLAAISYQESHWQVDASSYTGVRGLMMLTKDTAKEMGVEDRTDPAQSIDGGAAYFQKLKNRMPERVPEPDRTWFALAAYNVGYGHLEDARILAQADGKNPDYWYQVAQYLPKLREKKWHEKTRHGFARGEEPVRFVRNIRRFYDTLVWLDSKEDDLRQVKRRLYQLSIDLPTL